MADVDAITIPRLILYKRLFSKIEISSERYYRNLPCWQWTAFVNPTTGYAQFGVSGVGLFLAHRLIFELFVHKVPPKLQCDHLCRNRSCVNPAHIEIVTSKVNISRAIFTKKSGPKPQTHCINGHPFSGGNLQIRSHDRNDGTRGGMVGYRRMCRTCRNASAARRYKRIAKAKKS